MFGKNRAVSRDLPFHNSRMRPISSLHVPPSVPAQHAFPFPFWSDEESFPLPLPFSLSFSRGYGLRKVRGERAPRGLKGKKQRRWRGKHEKSWDRGGKKGGKGHVKNCTSAYISPATSGVILAISRAAVGTRTTMARRFLFPPFFFSFFGASFFPSVYLSLSFARFRRRFFDGKGDKAFLMRPWNELLAVTWEKQKNVVISVATDLRNHPQRWEMWKGLDV